VIASTAILPVWPPSGESIFAQRGPMFCGRRPFSYDIEQSPMVHQFVILSGKRHIAVEDNALLLRIGYAAKTHPGAVHGQLGTQPDG
jgi:hypothetical protein